jgi:glycerol-3-phosphate acyltransferase PlsY
MFTIMSIFYIILAYLLGSIPFGYIFSKISGKDILKIGWKKTSGSNVFRNVGKWQGLTTGLGDVGKGALAVWLAQNSGQSLQIQALCGVAAVTGHNWSCFLRLAGGRGIGTFIGAFLILSPKILGLSVIPFLLVALIWNAAIGTILFLITAIILVIYFGQLETVGLLPLVSLFPVFIKRLSPLKELSLKKGEVIKNRLIFDDNISRFDLRITRIIKRRALAKGEKKKNFFERLTKK